MRNEEVASSFARQGRDNPSREAYKSLQDEMAYDLTAGDYTLDCRVWVRGFLLAETSPALLLTHSGLYSTAKKPWKTRRPVSQRDSPRDFVYEAITTARSALTGLKQVA